MAGHIKQSVNDALFDKVYEAMSSEQKAICLLVPVPASKIMHFASEALSLPPRELRLGRMGAAKRNTLVLCAIERARIDVRDALGDMLCKRVVTMTNNAEEDLEQMRESLRRLNERIVSMMYDVTGAAEAHADDNQSLGGEVQGLLKDNGDAARFENNASC